MICPPCLQGGRLNRTAQTNPEANSDLMQLATEYHKHCEAPTTCPCQHRIGQMVPSATK